MEVLNSASLEFGVLLKLLLITTATFWPPLQGDSWRVLEMIRFFRRKDWRVYVVFWPSDDALPDLQGMAKCCDGLTVYNGSDNQQRDGGDACDDWCPDDLAVLAAETCVEVGANVVVAQYVHLSKCLQRVPLSRQILKVIDADNIFTGRRELFVDAGFDYDWFSTTEVEERKGLRRADLIVAVQEREAEALRQLAPDRPVVVVPPAERAMWTNGIGSDRLLFAATHDGPNEDGIRRFIAEALPEICRVRPQVRLMLAGTLDRGLATLSSQVDYVGYVPDLRDMFEQTAIVLNTTVCGTGIKSKTVRALCHAKCLVSTPSGVAGLERYQQAFLVAESPSEFAQAVLYLLGDRRRVREQALAAYRFASWYFNPDLVFGRLEQAILMSLACKAEGGVPGSWLADGADERTSL